MKSNIPVITIDGPSSSGKGTVGRLLAQALDWHFLDSGALYRALALRMLQTNILVEEEQKLAALIKELYLTFEFSGSGKFFIKLNGQEVTKELLSETCGSNASKIAVFPYVRTALLEKQWDFRKAPGLVADGRDMGSVVFPDAELKIFLSASLSERANRRYSQLKNQGIDVSLGTIEAELKIRDERDEKREVAPLKCAKDAILIDTTDLSITDVVRRIQQLIHQRLSS